jgi:leucyl aminopeptidase
MIDSKFADMKNTGGRWRLDHRSAVPQALRRRDALGASRHRRHRDGSPSTDINQSWASGFGVRLLDELVRANYEG